MFELMGGGAASTPTGDVTTQSTPSTSALSSAVISCTSATANPLVLYGGPSLAPFASSFEGK